MRFGVGWNDERLANHGITHAVEHLTLTTVGAQPYAWNGMVDAVSTNFSVTGSADEVVSHLDMVCRNLTALPTSGLRNELSVMLVEADKRQRNHLASDLGHRFGASGPGLADWPELGLRRVTPAGLQEWSDHWFTAANATLWISGPPPPKLSLHLPEGARVAKQTQQSRLNAGRYWVPTNTTSISISMVNEADPAALIGIAIARERIYDRLRTKLAVSYDVSLSSQQISPTGTLQLLQADGAPHSGSLILKSFADSLDELVDVGPTEAELELVLDRTWRALETDAGQNSWLHRSAGRILFGRDAGTARDEQEAMRAITPRQVADSLRTGREGLVAIGPMELGGALPGWAELPQWSDERVTGITFRADSSFATGRLVVGEAGISLVKNELQYLTVLWEEIAGCLEWDDGSINVVGTNGVSIQVSPWSWRSSTESTESPRTLVMNAIDESVKVHMGHGSGPPTTSTMTSAGNAHVTMPSHASNRRWAAFVREYSPYILGACTFTLAWTLGTLRGAVVFAAIVVVTVPTTRWVMRKRHQRRPR